MHDTALPRLAVDETPETFLARTHVLSQDRDGYAVLRVEWVTGEAVVLGYCRSPRRAVEVAAAMTTDLARPGERYEACTLERADRITSRTVPVPVPTQEPS